MLITIMTEATVADWRARLCHTHQGACDLDLIGEPKGHVAGALESAEGMDAWCPWIADTFISTVSCHPYFLADRRPRLEG